MRRVSMMRYPADASEIEGRNNPGAAYPRQGDAAMLSATAAGSKKPEEGGMRAVMVRSAIDVK